MRGGRVWDLEVPFDGTLRTPEMWCMLLQLCARTPSGAHLRKAAEFVIHTPNYHRHDVSQYLHVGSIITL
jgi:hypothetical protein